jgi:hypothetical protein
MRNKLGSLMFTSCPGIGEFSILGGNHQHRAIEEELDTFEKRKVDVFDLLTGKFFVVAILAN